MNGYLILFISILFEVIGSSMLKLSDGFTNLIPILILIVSYGIAFTLFMYALQTISLSVGYSIWAGLGTAGVGLIDVIYFGEVLSGINMLGLFAIISGAVIMNMGKKSEAETSGANVSEQLPNDLRN